jgi:hypothetical protein
MTKTYQGNTPKLYELFISGKQLQYSHLNQSDWIDLPVYNGEPDDVHRVADTYRTFRVKPKDVITKVYMHYNHMEQLVQDGTFYLRQPDNIMFDSPKGMNEHLEFTFINGKLTSVEMKGPVK